jgi:hypothetical protein
MHDRPVKEGGKTAEWSGISDKNTEMTHGNIKNCKNTPL